MGKMRKLAIIFCILWLVLMVLFDRPNYPTSDAEWMKESLKWGLP